MSCSGSQEGRPWGEKWGISLHAHLVSLPCSCSEKPSTEPHHYRLAGGSVLRQGGSNGAASRQKGAGEGTSHLEPLSPKSFPSWLPPISVSPQSRPSDPRLDPENSDCTLSSTSAPNTGSREQMLSIRPREG